MEYQIIDSLQAALDHNGKTKEQFDFETERDTDAQKAGKEIEEICKAVRNGNKEGRYYPWFWSAGSARGFSYCGYDCDRGLSIVGARHTVDCAEKAIFIGKHPAFLPIWDRHING